MGTVIGIGDPEQRDSKHQQKYLGLVFLDVLKWFYNDHQTEHNYNTADPVKLCTNYFMPSFVWQDQRTMNSPEIKLLWSLKYLKGVTVLCCRIMSYNAVDLIMVKLWGLIFCIVGSVQEILHLA